MDPDDVTVVRDEVEACDDGTAARVRIPRIPASERFERGVKYAYHYDQAGAASPIVRFDNHHGVHELHLGDRTFEIDFPGLGSLYRTWRAALPEAKRADWRPEERDR